MNWWSAIVDFVLGLLGLERTQSEGERLGRAEVKNADLKAANKAEKDALDAERKTAGMDDATVDQRLRADWSRKQ